MRRKKKVQLYTLSTCVWCKKTKRLLNEMGVDYDFTDVDLLSPMEERRIRDELEALDPNGGFPFIIIDDREILHGFDEDRIREALS